MTWLKADLAATTQPWIIAFWHHPPYSKGSHDSDTEVRHVEMREAALPVLEAGGVDLMLSGHTHGGQMWPWNFFVPLQQPIVAGLHRLHEMWIYVSRGTGYWGPPYRVGAPSEIALLTLTRA